MYTATTKIYKNKHKSKGVEPINIITCKKVYEWVCVCVSFWTAKQVQMLLRAVGGTRADHDKNYNTHVRSHWLKADFMGNCLLRSQHTYYKQLRTLVTVMLPKLEKTALLGKGNQIFFTSLIQTSRYVVSTFLVTKSWLVGTYSYFGLGS